jgi:hypothetical protein
MTYADIEKQALNIAGKIGVVREKARYKWTSAALLAMVSILSLLPAYFAGAAPIPSEQQNWKWEPYGPRVDEILMPVILDYDARLMALRKGDVDTGFIQPTRVAEVKDDPNIYILTYQTFNLQFLGINCQQYPWNYTAVRKAVAHLIDRDWIIRNVFNGFGVPVESAIPPAFGDWNNPNVPTYPYSRDLAKKELLDAGFTYDEKSGKWYDPSGKPLGDIVIQVPPQEQAPWLFQEAQRIADEGKSIGLPIKIEAIEFQALVSQIYSKTFKSFILYLGWDRVPTLAYELFRTGGSWNFWGISDPELDKLLSEFYFTTNITKAKEALWKAQEKVNEILPYIPIYSGIANVGLQNRHSWSSVDQAGWRPILPDNPERVPHRDTLRRRLQEPARLRPEDAQPVHGDQRRRVGRDEQHLRDALHTSPRSSIQRSALAGQELDDGGDRDGRQQGHEDHLPLERQRDVAGRREVHSEGCELHLVVHQDQQADAAVRGCVREDD